MTDRLTTLLHDEADRLDVRLPSPEQLRRASQRKRAVRRSAAAAVAAATTIAVVVPLTVSNPLGTSHRTPDSQIQPTGNTQHPSSSSSPSATYPTQFAGLPAVGAPVSQPANGTLVLNISPGTGGDWHVYADGRIIWQRWSRDHAPLVIPEGADPLHTSYVQQRLTPLGVQLLTSRILAIGGAVGLFRHNVVLVDPTRGSSYADWYQACNNGHLIYSQVIPPDIAAGATETSAQKRALARIDTLLADSTSLLPASAWADRTIRPYVPSHYELLWDRAAPDPSQLPSPAREALAKVLLGLNPQGTITTEQAQTLLAAFLQTRVKMDHNRANDAGLVFEIPGQDVSFSIGLEIRPAVPSSALSHANGC